MTAKHSKDEGEQERGRLGRSLSGPGGSGSRLLASHARCAQLHPLPWTVTPRSNPALERWTIGHNDPCEELYHDRGIIP